MKKIINTENAPAPIGPYNQSVAINGILFVSGQIAADPKTGELILDNIEAETTQVLENIGAILAAAGRSFAQVVKASVFVKDIHDFARINAVYSKYFDNETAPARE